MTKSTLDRKGFILPSSLSKAEVGGTWRQELEEKLQSAADLFLWLSQFTFSHNYLPSRFGTAHSDMGYPTSVNQPIKKEKKISQASSQANLGFLMMRFHFLR